ncbi:MAG: hypothetical protein QW607_08190 [Desulfurococcaceae archaeon]
MILEGISITILIFLMVKYRARSPDDIPPEYPRLGLYIGMVELIWVFLFPMFYLL